MSYKKIGEKEKGRESGGRRRREKKKKQKTKKRHREWHQPELVNTEEKNIQSR
mgnify:CR=1 FL=1